MNVFEKLQKSRVELQGMKLKKSGANKFAGYDYFELEDFIPQMNEIFHRNKLFSQISFTAEIATLTIYNAEKPEEIIVFTSPMAEAKLKGCHEIQNLGAVQSYQRRYLYMNALEIVERDALDTTTGSEPPKQQQQPNNKPPANNQSGPKKASEPQIKKLNTVITQLTKYGGTKDMIESALMAKEDVGKFTSIKDLSVGQASKAIKYVEAWIENKKQKQNGGN